MPVASGPDRPGLNKSSTNPFDESDIYMATKNPNGTWAEAVNLGLNGAYGDSSGMEINGGNTFVWLHGNGSSNDISIANKNPDGTWGAPIVPASGVNDPSAIQDNPHISEDGRALWFVSGRTTGGAGGRDIWFSTDALGDNNWSAPVNFSSVNTPADEDQMWISPVGLDVYWNDSSQGIMHCTWGGSNCAAPPTVVTITGCAIAAEVSMPDDGQTMYFACGDPTTGRVKIMYSTKQPDSSWGVATPVD